MQINVLEYFERGAQARWPEKVAVVDGERRLTFAELGREAERCAAHIVARTEACNRPIAVFLPKCAETIVADLAVLHSGNCYANLDVKSPPERLRAILANLGAELVVTVAGQVEALLQAGLPADRLLVLDEATGRESDGAAAELAARRERVLDTDPLCIIHTSGSTGVPKGVALSHRGTIDFLDWVLERFALGADEVIGSLSPFHFDIYTLELFYCLARGATLSLIPEQSAAFPARLLEFLEQHRVSFIFWVPTIMVNIANLDLFAAGAPTHLRTVFFAGEVFPTRHLNYWRRHLPGRLMVNLYGPIEICVDCTYYVVEQELPEEEAVPIGLPCRNTGILLLDEENRPVTDGEQGELCVRGSSLGLGYWNDPDRTAQAFTRNPLNPHYPELIYRTGDLAYRNARGELMFAGRKDFQIKHLGYRIELGEIEHAAVQVAGVRNACVLYDGKRREIAMAFEAERELSAGYLRERLAAFLPKYMLPTRFEQLTELPMNPNGKIDRHRLSVLLG